MKEIKFRGKNYDGIWMYGYLMPTPKPQIHLGNKHIVCACPQKMSRVDVELYEVEESTIGQYTGLKDKNGKEIYEGDIVKVTQLDGYNVAKIGIVEYRESNCRYVIRIPISICSNIFIFRELTNELCEDNDGRCTINWYNEYVVLGNIHDNPEFFKEKEK